MAAVLRWSAQTTAARCGATGSTVREIGSNWLDALMGATRTSAMIALILMGAAFLSLSMGFTGLPRALAGFIGSLELSPVTLILALMM